MLGHKIIAAAERGDLAAVLAFASVEEIADAWWRYALRRRAAFRAGTQPPDWDSDPDAWASELWFEHAVQDDEETVCALLRALADRAPLGADLGFLGAGPIDDFLAGSPYRLGWVVEQAQRSTNFRAALRHASGARRDGA